MLLFEPAECISTATSMIMYLYISFRLITNELSDTGISYTHTERNSQGPQLSFTFTLEARLVVRGCTKKTSFQLDVLRSVEFQPKILCKCRRILRWHSICHELPEAAMKSAVHHLTMKARATDQARWTDELKTLRLRTHSSRHRVQSASIRSISLVEMSDFPARSGVRLSNIRLT